MERKGLKEVGINKKTKDIIIKVSSQYFRPNEEDYLRGDYSKARKLLKWKPVISLNKMIKDMVLSDIETIKIINFSCNKELIKN